MLFKTTLTKFCTWFDIKLILQWIPEEQNYLAGFYSRMTDADNWSVESKSFNIITNAYRSFPVDRFAITLTKKVNKFNSKYFFTEHPTLMHLQTIGAVIITGIALSISCISSVVRYVVLCKARGTLLIPIRRSLYYCPLIYLDENQMIDFVKQHIVIEVR